MDLIGQTIFTAVDYAAILVMFAVTPELAGFTLAEVLLITSLTSSGFLLADLLVGNVEHIKTYVRTGTLDALLIRPRRILSQLLAIDFQLRRIGRVIFAVIALAISAFACGIDWGRAPAMMLIITPIIGAIFFSAIFIATASISFWWIDAGQFANAFTYGGREFTSYPISIYGGLFRYVFSFALGFGFIAYYPALAILDKPDPLGQPQWFAYLSPFVATVAVAIAAKAWRAGIRHYNSTGS